MGGGLVNGVVEGHHALWSNFDGYSLFLGCLLVVAEPKGTTLLAAAVFWLAARICAWPCWFKRCMQSLKVRLIWVVLRIISMRGQVVRSPVRIKSRTSSTLGLASTRNMFK